MQVNVEDGSYYSSKYQNITITDMLDIVGSDGKYQWRVFLTMSFVIAIQSFIITGQAYTFIFPPLLCNGIPCDQLEDYCTAYYEITVDPSFKYSNFVTQFDLFCDRKFYITIASSIYFVGSVIGGSLMSYIGVNCHNFFLKKDKMGRRVAYIISWAISLVGIIGVTTSFSIYQYIPMNFLIGFGATPCYILNYVMLNEVSGSSFRQKSSVGLLIAWGVTELICAYIFYAVVHWRIIYIGIAGTSILSYIGCYLYLHETPQFYLSKKNVSKSLELIGKTNNKLEFALLTSVEQEQMIGYLLQTTGEKYSDQLKETRVYSIVDLFSYPSLRKASLGFLFISFTLHFFYYGGEYSISDISTGNQVYTLGAIMGVSEVLAYCLIKQFIHLLPRKKSIIWSYILSIGACLCFLFFGFSSEATQVDCNFCEKQILVILIACSVRVFNCFAFALQGLYANEVYPTVVRSLGTGFLFAVGVLGSFFAPYAIAFAEIVKVNPYIILALLGLIGPIGTLLIRETLGRQLEDQIEEEKIEELFVNEKSPQ